MPRVKASMANVSTDFNPIEPGVHVYQIESVEEITDDNTNRTHYVITSQVLKVVENGNEADVGRKIKDRIHIHLKTGEENEFGLGQLKRYFEIIVGKERANDPDADTDWLIGQQFIGQTVIENYTVQDSLTGQQQIRKRNNIARMAPVA